MASRAPGQVRLPCGLPVVDRAACWLGPVCVACVCGWLRTGGHWLLNDVLAAALAVGLVSAFRLRSLRAAVLLLVVIAAYDAFWVYSSPWYMAVHALPCMLWLARLDIAHTMHDSISAR